MVSLTSDDLTNLGPTSLLPVKNGFIADVILGIGSNTPGVYLVSK